MIAALDYARRVRLFDDTYADDPDMDHMIDVLAALAHINDPETAPCMDGSTPRSRAYRLYECRLQYSDNGTDWQDVPGSQMINDCADDTAGRTPELRTVDTDDGYRIEWRYTDEDDNQWRTLATIRDGDGSGPAGRTPELRALEAADGLLIQWRYEGQSDDEWLSLGFIRFGRTPEFRTTDADGGTLIEWRYTDEQDWEWRALIAIPDTENGRTPELRASDADGGTLIEWRYTDEQDWEWRALIAIPDTENGRTPELRAVEQDNGTRIDWKYTDEDDGWWRSLTLLETASGDDGRTPEMRAIIRPSISISQPSRRVVQWKYTDEDASQWRDLYTVELDDDDDENRFQALSDANRCNAALRLMEYIEASAQDTLDAIDAGILSGVNAADSASDISDRLMRRFVAPALRRFPLFNVIFAVAGLGEGDATLVEQLEATLTVERREALACDLYTSGSSLRRWNFDDLIENARASGWGYIASGPNGDPVDLIPAMLEALELPAVGNRYAIYARGESLDCLGICDVQTVTYQGVPLTLRQGQTRPVMIQIFTSDGEPTESQYSTFINASGASSASSDDYTLDAQWVTIPAGTPSGTEFQAAIIVANLSDHDGDETVIIDIPANEPTATAGTGTIQIQPRVVLVYADGDPLEGLQLNEARVLVGRTTQVQRAGGGSFRTNQFRASSRVGVQLMYPGSSNWTPVDPWPAWAGVEVVGVRLSIDRPPFAGDRAYFDEVDAD